MRTINWITSPKVITLHGVPLLHLKKIALNKIFPIDMRTNRSEQKIREIKTSMFNGKKIPPIWLSPIKGGFRIYDGNHRYYATLDLIGKSGTIYAYVAR